MQEHQICPQVIICSVTIDVRLRQLKKRLSLLMCYDDCELRERLTPDLTADVGVVIHNGQAAEDKGRFIIRDIQNHSAASGAVDPEPVA